MTNFSTIGCISENIILDGNAKDDLSEALAAINPTITTTSDTQDLAEDGDRIIDLSTLEVLVNNCFRTFNIVRQQICFDTWK